MAKYKIAVALLCGAGFTSLVALLIRVLLPFSLLLFPGGILVHFTVRSDDFGPPLLVLAANVLVYSAAAYAGISFLYGGIAVQKMRLAALRLVLPVAILVGLACIPAVDPLWPRGMTKLAEQEKALQDALPVGMSVKGARNVLNSKRIQFQEQDEKSPEIVLQRQDKTITAAVGDRVISARLETEASQFPCGYDIEVVLLFGPDQQMKDQYVHRLRLCP